MGLEMIDFGRLNPVVVVGQFVHVAGSCLIPVAKMLDDFVAVLRMW
jgi:hypothetical protein